MKKGIDLSKHNGYLNSEKWEEIKKKVDFVILRIGYRGYGTGEIIKDSRFDEYLEKCIELNIPVGIYFYTQAVNAEEAREEAEFCLQNCNCNILTYGVWYDCESTENNGRADKISKKQRAICCSAFCDYINYYGFYCGVYCNYYWGRDSIGVDTIAKYPLWLANYTDRKLILSDTMVIQQVSDKNKFNLKGFNSLDCNITLADGFLLKDLKPSLERWVQE